MEEDAKFDITSALKAILEGKPLTGESGILTPLIKALTEAVLQGGLDSHLGREISGNRRNGKSHKTIKSLDGNFELRTPRERCWQTFFKRKNKLLWTRPINHAIFSVTFMMFSSTLFGWIQNFTSEDHYV